MQVCCASTFTLGSFTVLVRLFSAPLPAVYIVLTPRYLLQFFFLALSTNSVALPLQSSTMFKLLLAAALAAAGVCYTTPNATNSTTTFTNPILNTVGADP